MQGDELLDLQQFDSRAAAFPTAKRRAARARQQGKVSKKGTVSINKFYSATEQKYAAPDNSLYFHRSDTKIYGLVDEEL